ncbi:MAG: hypothetical protein ACYC3I_18905 [Gemmataceae bacterium]
MSEIPAAAIDPATDYFHSAPLNQNRPFVGVGSRSFSVLRYLAIASEPLPDGRGSDAIALAYCSLLAYLVECLAYRIAQFGFFLPLSSLSHFEKISLSI